MEFTAAVRLIIGRIRRVGINIMDLSGNTTPHIAFPTQGGIATPIRFERFVWEQFKCSRVSSQQIVGFLAAAIRLLHRIAGNQRLTGHAVLRVRSTIFHFQENDVSAGITVILS